MEPSTDELTNIVDVAGCFSWAKVEGDALTSVLALLGATSDAHPRFLASVSDNDLEAALVNFKVDEEAATPFAKASVRLAVRAARLKCGVVQPTSPAEVSEKTVHEEMVARLTVAATNALEAAQAVFQRAASDTQFWHDEVEQPGVLVATKAAAVGSVVDEDAPTSVNGPARKPLPQADSATERQAKMPKKVHWTDSSGKLVANRRGAPLCVGFQSGECSQTRPGPGRLCAGCLCAGCLSGPQYVHQCNVCLSPTHGGSACTGNPAKDVGGKGKGKGKGEKGRGNRTPY